MLNRSSVGLDPRTLAQVQILRRSTISAPNALKVLGVDDVEDFIRNQIDVKTRRALRPAIRKIAKKAGTLEEFIEGLDPVQQAYFIVNGPVGDLLVEIAEAHGQRWFDNKLNSVLKVNV